MSYKEITEMIHFYHACLSSLLYFIPSSLQDTLSSSFTTPSCFYMPNQTITIQEFMSSFLWTLTLWKIFGEDAYLLTIKLKFLLLYADYTLEYLPAYAAGNMHLKPLAHLKWENITMNRKRLFYYGSISWRSNYKGMFPKTKIKIKDVTMS